MSANKECELPAADSCALDEGEEQEDDVVYAKKSTLLGKLRSIAKKVFFTNFIHSIQNKCLIFFFISFSKWMEKAVSLYNWILPSLTTGFLDEEETAQFDGVPVYIIFSGKTVASQCGFFLDSWISLSDANYTEHWILI